MQEETVLGEVIAGPPDGDVVQRDLGVAVLDVAILNYALELVEVVVEWVDDVLCCFRNVP